MIALFKQKFVRGQILIISFVWILIFTIPVLIGNHTNDFNWGHILKIWAEYLVVFAIFLINRLVLIPIFFFNGKKSAYFISIILIITLFTGFIYLQTSNNPINIQQRYLPLPPGHLDQEPGFPPPVQNPTQREFIPPYGNLLILTILIIGFDSGLLFFSKWMQSEQNKLEAEKESIKNKMDFLQTQISPHFFMNTLNNIHALVDINRTEAKNAIIKLSRLMDYMLYESQTQKVLLQREINFITSYVELMKLRFTDDVEINLDIPSVLPEIKIPPLLIISFIENAFKYGISYESKSYIHIKINFQSKRIIFEVTNSNHHDKQKIKNSGIGISNTRKRLDLIYNNDYKLEINDRDNIFDVKLEIPL